MALMEALTQALQAIMGADLLTAESASRLAEAMSDIALGRSVAVLINPKLVEARRGAATLFLEKVVRVGENLGSARIEAAIEKLAEVLLPDDMGVARGAIASDNLAIRDRFVAEIPCFTSVEIGKNAGHKAENLYATAARWKKAGAVFSVSHRGGEVFPAFQFREGQPHPAIKKTLAALPTAFSPWQRALWFVSTNGWLGDKAPMDLLDDTDEVVAAARREGEVVG
jgi:hypothetical protein